MFSSSEFRAQLIKVTHCPGLDTHFWGHNKRLWTLKCSTRDNKSAAAFLLGSCSRVTAAAVPTGPLKELCKFIKYSSYCTSSGYGFKLLFMRQRKYN